MLTLLSPAKTMGTPAIPEGLATTAPRFEQDSAVLLDRCRELDVAALRQLMKLSEPLAELNHERFRSMGFPFTRENAHPCLLAFQGDVFKRLDAATLSRTDLEWSQDHLRILSGLYGLLRPLDLIQPYRLEMGTRLSNDRGRNLYEFWGDRLARSLNEEIEEQSASAVLNLASNEYVKAVPTGELSAPMVTAAFQEERDGSLKTIGFLAKKARGMMTRYVVRNRIDSPDGLREFDDEGYAFRPELSDAGRLVFTRPDSRSA